MNQKRTRPLNSRKYRRGPVIYWMSRDQRAQDNWALIHTIELAQKQNVPFAVVVNLVPSFLDATFRSYDFMLEGLKETANELKKLKIPFYLLSGEPQKTIPDFAEKVSAGMLVTDFLPLNINKKWITAVAKKLDIPFEQVDAHNIVPCWITSPKQEFGAYTIRPKIHKLLPEFLDEFPSLNKLLKPQSRIASLLKKRPAWNYPVREPNFRHLESTLKIDFTVLPVKNLRPGSKEGLKRMKDFIGGNLRDYDTAHNDPNLEGQSGLSPYLHFGQISAQRVALEILKIFGPDILEKNTNAAGKSKKINSAQISAAAFMEELIVRRELSDNYCFYNPDYESFQGFPAWARKNLNIHRMDPREYLYTQEQFEFAQTHDPLWNSAQEQMVTGGKMHGYMRMYWAKKILEWSPSVEQAQKIAIYLNDKYSLDGRDPNGYAGIAWSMGGLHDRPWSARPVFGQIRFMSYGGCKSKFNVASYIENN